MHEDYQDKKLETFHKAKMRLELNLIPDTLTREVWVSFITQKHFDSLIV